MQIKRKSRFFPLKLIKFNWMCEFPNYSHLVLILYIQKLNGRFGATKSLPPNNRWHISHLRSTIVFILVLLMIHWWQKDNMNWINIHQIDIVHTRNWFFASFHVLCITWPMRQMELIQIQLAILCSWCVHVHICLPLFDRPTMLLLLLFLVNMTLPENNPNIHEFCMESPVYYSRLIFELVSLVSIA